MIIVNISVNNAYNGYSSSDQNWNSRFINSLQSFEQNESIFYSRDFQGYLRNIPRT